MAASTPAPHWIERLVASRPVRAAYASTLLHVLALILLALVQEAADTRQRRQPILLGLNAAEGIDAADAVDELAVAIPLPPASPVAVDARPAPALDAALTPAPVVATPPLVPLLEPIAPPAQSPPTIARPAALAVGKASPAAARPLPGDVYASRGAADRAEVVRSRGGTPASEAAVAAGLAWLARHQGGDGSWRFDLSNCRCAGACRHPGSITSTTASTGLALLAFLGAGHTSGVGPHQETVTRGLYHLLDRLRPTPRGGDLGEGTMYGHGVATLALAEALGMTRDEMLVAPITDAVRFIVTAQDSYGGGWRYLPGQAGDTTVTAWQLAALKSAALAGIEVPSPTIDGVRRFLDRVQARDGEAYGYLGPQPKPCTSAIGLFCRLHTGWHDREAIERGLAGLARAGPDPTAVYLNFYLAQALLQSDHPAWPRWNTLNRDQLVKQQARQGHETGSWFFADPETAPGGRLAHTALAVLTLEVYYRLLPLFQAEAVDRDL